MSNPDLSAYSASFQTEKRYTLQARTVFWVDIGTAIFSALTPSQIALEASYRVLGKSGQIALDVSVTEDNVGEVVINGYTLACRFTAAPKTLTVDYQTGDGKPQKLSFTLQKNGILVDGDVVPVKVLIKA